MSADPPAEPRSAGAQPAEPPIPDRPREIRATGPKPDAEGLRTAYLDLLKLALCDLAGVTTEQVWRGDGGELFTRELPDDSQRRWRVDGSDWPVNGLTMVGLRRLDDLQRCVEDTVTDHVQGDVIECGAWRGGASILTRATLDSLGASDKTVWVADSFQGFPAPESDTEDEELDFHMSAIDYLAPVLDAVHSYFERFGVDRGVEFLPGFFEDTLEQMRGRTWSLIRLDADGYQATRLALDVLYPGLQPGGWLVIDDYFHMHLPVCRQAVQDFRAEHGITDPIERIDWVGARWRRTTEGSPAIDPPPASVDPPAHPHRAVAERTGRKIPTAREYELELELAGLRAQLAELKAELEAAQSRPPLAALARRRGRRGNEAR